MEGGQGWVLQGVLARAAIRRYPDSGQNKITVLCLHISNVVAKKQGIVKKLILTIRAMMTSQQVDLIAGDFNGTAQLEERPTPYSYGHRERDTSDIMSDNSFFLTYDRPCKFLCIIRARPVALVTTFAGRFHHHGAPPALYRRAL